MRTADPIPRLGRRQPDPRRRVFLDMLRRHGGNVKATAKALGIHRVTAFRWRRDAEAGKLLAGLDEDAR